MFAGIGSYLVRMLPGAILAALAFFCLLPIRNQRLHRAGLCSPFHREVFLFLFFLFCGGMAIITLMPRWFHWLTILNDIRTEVFFQIGTFNLIPFRTFSFDSWSFMILLGNVIMFFPFGFFAVLLWRNISAKRILLIGVLTSLFIEFTQLFVGRSFDIDDILLNTLGVLLGGLFCYLLQRLLPPLTQIFHVQNA